MVSNYCKVLVVLCLACVALGSGYGGYGGGHGHGQGYGYAPQQAYYPKPQYNYYAPDNAYYYYNTYHYDPYYYKDANVKFNRFPGGAAYHVNEQGKGSNVDVNVETYRAGYKGY